MRAGAQGTRGTPCAPPPLPNVLPEWAGARRDPLLPAPAPGQQRCLPWLQEQPSPAPGPVTGSSKTPRVQRHFMLTEHFSARNLRLNKLESTLRRKQKMEGEELALSCTARSRCTLEESQVRCTSNPHLATCPWGRVCACWQRCGVQCAGATAASLQHTPQSPEMLASL